MSEDRELGIRPLATNAKDALFVEFQAHLLRKICETFSGRRSPDGKFPPTSDEAAA